MQDSVQFYYDIDMRDDKIRLRFQSAFLGDPSRHQVPGYRFGICSLEDGYIMGEITLRISMNSYLYYSGHIGYTVLPQFRGHGYACRAAKLILTLAARHGMASVLITCNPDNIPSLRTIQKLGGRLVEVVDVPTGNDLYLRGDRQKCVYRVDCV